MCVPPYYSDGTSGIPSLSHGLRTYHSTNTILLFNIIHITFLDICLYYCKTVTLSHTQENLHINLIIHHCLQQWPSFTHTYISHTIPPTTDHINHVYSVSLMSSNHRLIKQPSYKPQVISKCLMTRKTNSYISVRILSMRHTDQAGTSCVVYY
jgi:hypothetical protein